MVVGMKQERQQSHASFKAPGTLMIILTDEASFVVVYLRRLRTWASSTQRSCSILVMVAGKMDPFFVGELGHFKARAKSWPRGAWNPFDRFGEGSDSVGDGLRVLHPDISVEVVDGVALLVVANVVRYSGFATPPGTKACQLN